MSQNLFDTDPAESLFGGDPRNLFERLRSAGLAFERDYQNHVPPSRPDSNRRNKERAVYVTARLLRLLCDRVEDNDDRPLANNLAVESALYTVIYTIIGRHLDPDEVFRD